MASTTGAEPGYDFTTITLVELLGVGLFTILAGFDDNLGRITVIVMWGLILGWALLHTSQLKTMVQAI